MGRVSFLDCRSSMRNSFLLAVSLCQGFWLKVVGLGLAQANGVCLGGRHPPAGQPCSGCGCGCGR